MRALYVINNPEFGGGHNQMLALREPLAARGWEMAAVTPIGSSAAPRLRAGGVEVHEMELHRLRASTDPRLQAAFLGGLVPEVSALRRLIKRLGIDVVQAHGDLHPHAPLAGRWAGIAVVWQIYDTRTPVRLRRVTMPLVTRLADSITTWGERLGHEYPGTTSLGDRWITVFPPVDGRRFKPDPQRRAAARAELGIKDGEIAVACVGMRNPSKGHDHFVRALGRARRSHPELVGRIIGGVSRAHAEYERAFREEAQRLGLFDGHALEILDGGSRVPELLPAFDVLALSSVPRSEGMPTVILEAMACGIPVVATDVGAVRELVLDGETAIVVEPEDDDALAAGLERLAADADLRRRFGEAGRRRFEQVFQLDRLAERHISAFEAAREHARGRRRRA